MAIQLFNQKSNLRKMMKQVLKNISSEEKSRQSLVMVDHLLNKNSKFANSKHVALYLAMKQEELDTLSLIEAVFSNKEKFVDKHIYVPHVEMCKEKTENTGEMVFFELKNLEEYLNDLNDDNKYKIKQFSHPETRTKASIDLFDLVIVPGLAFDHVESNNSKKISRLGRGKGYYDAFLSKIPNCYTLGIGFSEQFISFNKELLSQQINLPFSRDTDALLNEYLCEKMLQI